jgi:hypothetical protein
MPDAVPLYFEFIGGKGVPFVEPTVRVTAGFGLEAQLIRLPHRITISGAIAIALRRLIWLIIMFRMLSQMWRVNSKIKPSSPWK